MITKLKTAFVGKTLLFTLGVTESASDFNFACMSPDGVTLLQATGGIVVQ
jgi:hypothetical protein